jgi:uncharacterized protein (TIGR03435 family)
MQAAVYRRRAQRGVNALALLVWTAAVGFGQDHAAPLTFEVASIKPSSADDHRTAIQFQPGGGFRASGVTLKMLIAQAYDVREFQISGGPNWIGSERFDITARAERAAGAEASTLVTGAPSNLTDSERKTMQEQMAQRLQALLADRFHLAIQRETKEQQGYALVVAKGGPKMHPAENKPDERQGMLRMGRGSVEGHGVPLDPLIHFISSQLGRPVADRTGLTGHFDIDLKWTPEPGQSTMPPGGGPEPPPADPNGPSLFTALQEQLGLRLESEKALVDLIVVDHVEKPSEN